MSELRIHTRIYAPTDGLLPCARVYFSLRDDRHVRNVRHGRKGLSAEAIRGQARQV